MLLKEKKPYFVHVVNENGERHSKVEMVLALQLKKRLKRGHETYLAVLVEIHEGHNTEVPNSVVVILKEFKDIMPLELHKIFFSPTTHLSQDRIDAKGQTSYPSSLLDGPSKITGTQKTIERITSWWHDSVFKSFVWCTCFVLEEA